MSSLAEEGGGGGNGTHRMDLPDALLRTLVPHDGGPSGPLDVGEDAAVPNATLRPHVLGPVPHLPWSLLSAYAAMQEHHHDAAQRAQGGAQTPGSGGGASSGADLGFEVVEFLHQYYVPAMIAMGLVGNLLSCIVFLNTHLRLRSSSYYLAALATADFGYLAVLVLVWLDGVHGVQVFVKEGWCQVVTYVSSVCAFVSVWLIVAFTVERFIAVQYPLHRPHMCTVARAKAIVVCIAAFGIISHIYTLKTRGIVRDKEGYESCEMLDQHRSVMRVITLVDAIVTLVMPVVLIIVMNTMITRNLVLFGRRFKQAGVAEGGDTAPNSWADGHLGAESCDSRSSNAPTGGRRQQSAPFAIKVSASRTPSRTPSRPRGAHRLGPGPKGGASLTQDSNTLQAADPPDVTLCLGPGLGPGLGHKAANAAAHSVHPHFATLPRAPHTIPISAGRTLVSTRTQQSITKMLLLISSVFITLNMPSHVLRVYASVAVFTGTNLDMKTTSSLWFGQQISMLLYYTNFSINFLLYSMCGITFRRCLWQLVRGCGRSCGCGSRWSECQFR